MLIIKWQNVKTGEIKSGSPLNIKYLELKLYVDDLNKEYPGILHWIEEVNPCKNI